jgi:tRNA(Ile)-lysidine synthase
VALAHNSGDLSETVLMRIIRGTGPDGLAGISADRSAEEGYRIVRPLIDTSRAEIEEYCSRRGLNPRRDSTNDETGYLRNSIRLELLPMMREKYNPAVDDALARLSAAAAESRDYFDSLVNGIIERECGFSDVTDRPSAQGMIAPSDAAGEAGPAGPLSASLPIDALEGLHPAVRHRIVAGVFGRIGLSQDIGASHISAAEELMKSGRTGKSVDFPGGYRFGVSYGRAVFTAPRAVPGDSAIAAETASFKIAIPEIESAGGRLVLFEGSAFPIEAMIADYDGCMKSGAALVLDYEALSSAASMLGIRARATGDRIHLPGMDGSKKLQDVFVDEKIPRGARGAVPVIATENEVLWIPGIRRTRLYEPAPATKRVLILTPVATDGASL